MYVTGSEVQLFSDLAVGNFVLIKSHQVQAGNPNLERLMITCEICQSRNLGTV